MLDFFQTTSTANSAKGTPGFASQFVSPLETQSFLETLTSRTRTGFRSHTEQPEQENYTTHWREPGTQRLTTARASARSPAAPADKGPATGVQRTSISAFSTPTHPP